MQEKKFISLLNDTTFKYLWKEKRSRDYFEQLVLKVCNIDLSDYELIDNEQNTGNEEKDYRLDILLKKDNHIVNIEMNNSWYEYNRNKNYSYLYRLAGNQYKKGEDYRKKYYVTQINFNNSYCDINENIGICTFEFMDKKNDIIIEGIKNHEIYLENYRGICYNGENEKEMYLSMLTAVSYDD